VLLPGIRLCCRGHALPACTLPGAAPQQTTGGCASLLPTSSLVEKAGVSGRSALQLLLAGPGRVRAACYPPSLALPSSCAARLQRAAALTSRGGKKITSALGVKDVPLPAYVYFPSPPSHRCSLGTTSPLWQASAIDGYTLPPSLAALAPRHYKPHTPRQLNI